MLLEFSREANSKGEFGCKNPPQASTTQETEPVSVEMCISNLPGQAVSVTRHLRVPARGSPSSLVATITWLRCCRGGRGRPRACAEVYTHGDRGSARASPQPPPAPETRGPPPGVPLASGPASLGGLRRCAHARRLPGARSPPAGVHGGYWRIVHPIACHTDMVLPARRSLISEPPPLPREEPIASDRRLERPQLLPSGWLKPPVCSMTPLLWAQISGTGLHIFLGIIPSLSPARHPSLPSIASFSPSFLFLRGRNFWTSLSIFRLSSAFQRNCFLSENSGAWH